MSSPLESFRIPDTAEVLVATHLLELYRDLELPDDVHFLRAEPRDDLFVGWTPKEKAAIAGGAAEVLKADTSPVTRLLFRRVYMHERPYFLAGFAAFDDLLEPFADPAMLAPLRAFRESDVPIGMFDWISVVAATRYLPVASWPSDPSEQQALLGDELDTSLGFLNEFLISLGLARQKPAIGPVTRGDLPSKCTVILETSQAKAGLPNGAAFHYQIHSDASFPRREPRSYPDLDEPEKHAFRLARSAYHGQQPFFLLYELMQQTFREFNGARFAASAVSIGTAIEVLFSTAIRESGQARGLASTEVDRVLAMPLRSQIEHHFSRFVTCHIDLLDTANPFGRWWSGGYKLRNRVVHDGHRPSREEVDVSLKDASMLIQHIRESLGNDAATQSVGEQLQWGSLRGGKDIASNTS